MKSSLDATYERYQGSLLDVPISVQQDLHLYMCIRLSGYLEQLLHQAICDYMSRSASGPAREFALSWFRKAPNLNPDALEKLIARFGEKWSSELSEFLDIENNRSSLGTLIRIRNDTAHGRSWGGSSLNVRSYKELVDAIHVWVMDKMFTSANA
ncbi:HEPN domain-containing protein [Nocardia sp. NPDC006630]|uniref:HEPN domain-containing protein n=1 Tax=Nocardia sp. NPDC006630 TaxID=3157181 RepID=UPI0033AB788C